MSRLVNVEIMYLSFVMTSTRHLGLINLYAIDNHGISYDWEISAISIQLSASDQHEKTKEMYNKVVEDVIVEQHPEESEEDMRVRTFTELFKKLPFPDQNHFLSTIIKKFKRERKIGELISWFSTQLDASEQQELIGVMVHVKDDDETVTNEDLRLRRFTQLLFRLALIEQLCDGVIGVIIEKLEDESEAEFKLRRFTELCKRVVDFGVQVHFLDEVEQKLLQPRRHLPHGVLLQPQDSASAAELLSKLSSFGFSLLSIDDQQDKIKQISNKFSAEVVIIERLAGESEEDLRKKTFTKLFNKAPVSARVNLFKELTNKFFGERCLCESILLFRQLGSRDQQERIEEMFGRLVRSEDAKNVILEKVDEESEGDFRLRRFIKMCITRKFLLDEFLRNEAKKWDLKGLQLQISGNKEIDEIKQCRYAEFYFGLSIIWFKTRCAKNPKNPVQVLVRNVGEADYIIEKLQHETEEDFRLRRFTESFEQLHSSSQEDIVKYIKRTIFHDIGYHEPKPMWQYAMTGAAPADPWFDGMPPFTPQFIKVKPPKVRGAITQGGGDGAVTQGGQGASQQ
ncbi:uncharacterized protein LOC126601236 [Malus sylvestris]|uniref:uncharacterized protein LOC126601217 n=1 Tax=Malus sylvestris TaxID=3752 RepID=UPI0021AD344C|nr:uncharacterized protein LOC126601217 [Malus sylvestris]XP_050123878.1 uncharacterized protein LOC126601236 [Malus sylvestris]